MHYQCLSKSWNDLVSIKRSKDEPTSHSILHSYELVQYRKHIDIYIIINLKKTEVYNIT